MLKKLPIFFLFFAAFLLLSIGFAHQAHAGVLFRFDTRDRTIEFRQRSLFTRPRPFSRVSTEAAKRVNPLLKRGRGQRSGSSFNQGQFYRQQLTQYQRNMAVYQRQVQNAEVAAKRAQIARARAEQRTRRRSYLARTRIVSRDSDVGRGPGKKTLNRSQKKNKKNLWERVKSIFFD